MVKGWSNAGGEAGALALMLDLGPYVNTSAAAVQSSFSVERAHMLFRSLGLRHLSVVDAHNRVRGIITRKVMCFKLLSLTMIDVNALWQGRASSSEGTDQNLAYMGSILHHGPHE